VLTVSFQKEDMHGFRDVVLTGDTALVYEGVVGPDVFRLYEKLLQGEE
jgi:hypothetical protein